MVRALLVLSFITGFSYAQVRVEKLVIRKGETYSIAPSDILVADTLVMMDSSTIRLNGLKDENFIRVNVAIIGDACVIDGTGIKGNAGLNGRGGISAYGPCQSGAPGRKGGRGLDGSSGLDLYLYIDQLSKIGRLVIDLSGGNGGNGGDGGEGGGGSPGTMHCSGGNGGAGGDGGAGGNGGQGGTLTLGGRDLAVLRSLLRDELVVYNKGGSFGYGGIGGHGGAPGLGPDRRNGKAGPPGTEGSDGEAASNGTILFEGK